MVQLPNGQQVVVQQQGLHPQSSMMTAVTPTQHVPLTFSSAGPGEVSALSQM